MSEFSPRQISAEVDLSLFKSVKMNNLFFNDQHHKLDIKWCIFRQIEKVEFN